jgi:hypothetical protein
MKPAVVILLALAAGCSTTPTQTWLVVDDALLASDDAGKPWCADGGAPDVFVAVRTPGGAHADTHAVARTYTPIWDEAVLAAEGPIGPFTVEVVGDCRGTRRFVFGAAHVRGGSGGLRLAGFGAVKWLRLHFERIPDGYAPDAPSAAIAGTWVAYAGGDGVIAGDGSIIDDGTPVDDGSWVDDPSGDGTVVYDSSGDVIDDGSYTNDPYANDPYANDPYANDPNATDPNATDPNATDPTATDPNATDGSTAPTCDTCLRKGPRAPSAPKHLTSRAPAR